MLGLYIHVPFCSSICSYCNFNRGLFEPTLKARYIDAVVREIRASADGSSVDTVFFGGGTPSLLEPAEIGRILTECQRAFDLVPGAEVTLEANPDSATDARLEGYRGVGVNRLSLGVQSFRNDELRRLGREHSAEVAVDAFARARRASFDNVSLDLMMWLPAQTTGEWLDSVEALIGLAPEHASLYMLEIYPNAPLRDAMARGSWSVAPDDDAAEMYLLAMTRLEAAGYSQYEISNVAQPGRQSRHNLKYWTDGEWLGLGCGAHSTRAGSRWKNVSSTDDYISRVEAGRPLRVEQRDLSPQERLEETLFTGLRLSRGVDLSAIAVRFGVDVWDRYEDELTPFVDEGLLIYDDPIIRLSRGGMLLAHEVMAVFIQRAVR